MLRILYQAFLLFFIVAPAFAQADMHVQSAFLFADRKNWSEAILHAQQSHNQTLEKLVIWQALLDNESGASFQDIAKFTNANPNWPQITRLKLRAEQAIRSSTVSERELTQWFEKNPPISGAGKLALIELGLNAQVSKNDVAPIIRDAWINGDFDELEEKRILSVHGTVLRGADHIERLSRLIWQEKFTAATRMLDFVSPDIRTLARARMALLSDDKNANYLISQVTRPHKNDPGLIYARMIWRAKHNDDDGVREMLLDAPERVPFPEKWWKYRESQTRKAIGAWDFRLAKTLMSRHGQTEGSTYADALWLNGWLQLEFLRKPEAAYTEFRTQFDAVKFPVSKARAAYWAGRAAEKAGDMQAATSWYTNGAAYPSTFYGQLSAMRANGNAPLRLPADPVITKEASQRFQNNELVKVIRLAFDNNHADLATQFMNHIIDSADKPEDMALAASLGSELHSTMLGVRAAKRALQQNTLLLLTGYPQPKLTGAIAVEPALALAIARQESEFDPRARSRAGALGLMQLLPGTAKETAQKNDIPYAENRLTDQSYNVTLGSAYLNRMIKNNGGSYVMAIASYNAGPRRVREWVSDFGAPGALPDSAIDWIEKIPFSETRNYVQRVLENLQVYRHLTAGGKAPNLRLEEDLVR